MQTSRLRVVLTITLSELMSEVQVTHMKSDGTLEESGEACRLRKSLEEMADESESLNKLREFGLPDKALLASREQLLEHCCTWSEVKVLSDSLLLALDASLEHALLVYPDNPNMLLLIFSPTSLIGLLLKNTTMLFNVLSGISHDVGQILCCGELLQTCHGICSSSRSSHNVVIASM